VSQGEGKDMMAMKFNKTEFIRLFIAPGDTIDISEEWQLTDFPAQFPTEGALASATQTVLAVAKVAGLASLPIVIWMYYLGGLMQYVYSIMGVMQMIVFYKLFGINMGAAAVSVLENVKGIVYFDFIDDIVNIFWPESLSQMLIDSSMDLPSTISFNSSFGDMGFERAYILVIMYWIFLACMASILRFIWLKAVAVLSKERETRR